MPVGLGHHWTVVGGAGKGGILVRVSHVLGSQAFPERLSTGSVIKQVELIDERLNYHLVAGSGPKEGWVSIRISSKELVIPELVTAIALASDATEASGTEVAGVLGSESTTKLRTERPSSPEQPLLPSQQDCSPRQVNQKLVEIEREISDLRQAQQLSDHRQGEQKQCQSPADSPPYQPPRLVNPSTAAAPETKASSGGGFQRRIADHKKVKIVGLFGDGDGNSPSKDWNGKTGSIEEFDSANGLYKVKIVGMSAPNAGLRALNQTFLHLPYDNIQLHQDQVERDAAMNGDEIVLLGAGDAKKKLYEVRLDPQYWYDKAIERVFKARHDFEVLDLPAQWTEDKSILKKAYRKISLAVHPDKNHHPQAADAFRKVYGAFETLMDERQQRRLLWIMGKLHPDEEEQHFLEEDEDDELFQWWWEASVPEIEKQVAELEGQQLDEFGAMWISDGLGGNVEDVAWIGLQQAKRLHQEGKAIFVDVRDYHDFAKGHIEGAYSTPLPDMIDFGVVDVFQRAGQDLIPKMLRKMPIIVYSEVATPFSRCRAWCRWLLRAGHKTIKAKQVRRLRGGIFGWKFKDGPLSRSFENGETALCEDNPHLPGRGSIVPISHA